MKNCRKISFIILILAIQAPAIPDRIPLGGIFSTDSKEVESAFKYALFLHNNNNTSTRFKAEATVNQIHPYDTFSLSKIICAQMKKGIFAAVGTTENSIYRTVKSFNDLFHMPYISNGLPSVVNPYLFDFAVDMRPDFTPAITDTIRYYGWKSIIYLYDSEQGLLKLQEILKIVSMKSSLTNSFKTVASLKSDQLKLNIKMAQRIHNGSHAISMLMKLEARDRESKKYIVLDCTAATAKYIIMEHASKIKLGKRNYHYLLADLVLDEPWSEEIQTLSVINVTSFKIINNKSSMYKKFVADWQILDPFIWPGAGAKYISANAAFMFDGARTILDAFDRMLKDNRNIFQKNIRRGEIYNTENKVPGMICRAAKDVTPWEHGRKILEYIKETNITGLTGNITFNDLGRRNNFEIKILEVLEGGNKSTIATWSDTKGFKALRKEDVNQENNKTYIVTTILEEPYLFMKTPEPGQELKMNERFDGYCADLANLIAEQLRIKLVLKLVNDSQYGTRNPAAEGGWDGMIGELITSKADIAIAPLTITSERERVIDFTKPYMSQGISVMIKKPAKQKPGVFSFMNPLSRYIWASIILAYLGVSIVLFIVSRFSPYEWHILNTASGPKVSNEFSLYNSLWFSLGAFMQQGCDICPRSVSGRIIGSCWWLFTLIIVSSYTANLAAFLTVEKIVAPINSADDLSKQTEVEYGIYKSGSTYEFFKKSKIAVYARMNSYMEANPHVFADTYESGIERVRNSKGKYAFLLESAKNDYINERQPCNTMKVGKNLDSKGYGLATPLKSPIREDLNLAVLRIKENGNLARLENKWWYDRSECKNTDSKDSQQNELTLSNVAGIFYMLIGGLILSMFVVFLEFCYKAKVDAEISKMSLLESMKAKARMSIQGSEVEYCSKHYHRGNQLLAAIDGIVEPYHGSYTGSFSTNTHTQV